MNIEHLGGLERRFVLPGMDAVHGADVHARGILGPDAWLANDIRHWTNSTRVLRSRARPAVHAAAPAPGALRGLRVGRAAAAGQRPCRRGRRAPGRVRHGGHLRPAGAGAALWRHPCSGVARLDPHRGPVRVHYPPLALPGRLADAPAAGYPRDSLRRYTFPIAMIARIARLTSVLVVCVAHAAGEQGLSSEPIALASGRVTVSGDLAASYGSDDPGFFNYTDYDHSAL